MLSYTGTHISQAEVFATLQNLQRTKLLNYFGPLNSSLVKTSFCNVVRMQAVDSITGFAKRHVAATRIDLGGTISILQNIEKRFDRMYSFRAYVHWFVGIGMESGEYSCKREELAALVKDYEEVSIIPKENDDSDSDI